MDEAGYSGRLRKRRKGTIDGCEEVVNSLFELAETCGKLVVFTGSGLSANSGMSMFTTKNGLYERARQKFKIQDGIKLFSYPFYKQRRKDVQAFFAQIYSEAQSSRAAPGHVALAQLHQLGRLQRHYTLNIDGLAHVVGMDTWHHENNPEGITVEMHGNISYVVCPSCHAVESLTGNVMTTMRASKPVVCSACHADEMRFKVMLYDDEQGDCITPEDVFERLEEDLELAGAVLWVGISFEQSASTEYFRKVRHMLSSQGRGSVPQVIINPSDEAYFNVVSTMSNKEDFKVLDVRGTSDDVLPRLVQHLHQQLGTKPDAASTQAAAEAAAAAAAARRKRQKQEADAAAEAAAAPPSGQRSRRGSSARSSPARDVPAPGMAPGSAELEVLDGAAAAALAVPPAVQRHFLQRQLQQQQQREQSQQPPQQQQQQQLLQAGVAFAAAAQAAAEGAGRQDGSNVAAGGQPAACAGDGLQLLLAQLQALHAVQAVQAQAAQRQAAAAVALPAAQQPGAAAAAAGAAAAVPPAHLQAALQALRAQQLAPHAADNNPAAAQPAGPQGLAQLLLSSPAVVATLAAAAAGAAGNGAAQQHPSSATGTLAGAGGQGRSAAAAAAAASGAANGAAGTPAAAPAVKDEAADV